MSFDVGYTGKATKLPSRNATGTINGNASQPQNSHNAPLEKVVREASDSMVLKLDGRNLREFPIDLSSGSLIDVEFADFSYNSLEEVSQELCDALLSLHTLKCLSNRIKCISLDLNRLQHLQSIDFSCNQLCQFPEALLLLPQLSVLAIRSNRLSSVPSTVNRLQSLTKLDMSHNELCTLPGEIGDLQSLKYLNVSFNALLSLPEEVTRLSLRQLLANENRLSSLPLNLHTMTSLHVLHVHNNPLTKPPLHVALRGRLHIFHYLQRAQRQEARKQGFLQGNISVGPQLTNGNGGQGVSSSTFGVSQFEKMQNSRDSGYVTSESSSDKTPSEVSSLVPPGLTHM
jgi:Leucine-rich repeat (LRR) protein